MSFLGNARLRSTSEEAAGSSLHLHDDGIPLIELPCIESPRGRSDTASLMSPFRRSGRRKHTSLGFTLVELLVSLVVLSILALLSYRGLSSVIDARIAVQREVQKWQGLADFFHRFESDIRLASPAPARINAGSSSDTTWDIRRDRANWPIVAFTRFESPDRLDGAKSVGYGYREDTHQIDLWLWPGPGSRASPPSARIPILSGVSGFDIQFLAANGSWSDTWPGNKAPSKAPAGLRLRIRLDSGEEITRVFAL